MKKSCFWMMSAARRTCSKAGRGKTENRGDIPVPGGLPRMHMLGMLGILVLSLMLALVGDLYAQSITISPNSPTTGVGQSFQFSAQVSGLSSTEVIWSVGGVKGGNATVGTISPTGLYQAPVNLPPQNPVLITATSTVNTKVAGSIFIYLFGPGPAITGVSPNPVATGTFTTTITGSGFQPGATVLDTYGSLSVQLTTVSVTPTTITATGYQGPAGSASFCVKNPGTLCSNSISVPVAYTLNVVNGAGSGVYPAANTVTITANAPPAGKVFANWTGATVANANASTTTLTMPAANTTVTANYAVLYYKLTVVNGTGGGFYPPGAVVKITANAPSSGQAFANWTGATVGNPLEMTTTLTMPATNASVTANYTTIPTYTLTVVNGTGSGSYPAGKVVTIAANTPPSGSTFLNWTGATVASANSSTTTLTMPAAATTVTANYTAGTYTLTVVNGTGSGSYAPGTVVAIKANTAPSGQKFSGWTGATVAKPGETSTTLTMPAAATTVTATYAAQTYALTVVNGTGSGSYAAGNVVTISAGPPPSGKVFLHWTGATVANPNASVTTLTMPAAATTVTASYAMLPVPIPYPVSSHPRLWVTVNDLPRLRSWATTANPIYQQGMVSLLSQAVSAYQTQYFPNGVANPSYPDGGDINGYTGRVTEQVGVVLAFNSLIDPNPVARIKYAQYARNMLMYVMNQAALGHLSGAPFRDPGFAINNRANYYGEQWPLIVDWIYNAADAQGNPILSAADKVTIRNVFMMWANDCVNASTASADHPSPIGATNDLQLLPGNKADRWAVNNYYLGHARLLTMMALSIDPADDPPVDTTLPASLLGNTLRSYIPNATGAWLYQQFAMLGDPSVVTGAYGIPGDGTGLGLASGGLPPEGMLYGHSYGYILGQLLALQTAGFNDTTYSGPQIQLIGAPVWDRFVTGYVTSLTPAPKVFAAQSSLGPVYQYGSYGDLLRLWVTPQFMQPFALLSLIEQLNGKTTHLNTARWFAVNVVEGGSNALLSRVSNPWSYSATSGILYYMLLDPAAPAATDPRPTLPTMFYDRPAGRIVAHSDWSANGTMFDYRASWISINHQLADGGQFELYRKGEWLTKEMSNYDNNMIGMTTPYHNTLALQNWSAYGTPTLNWFENWEWANGSQWMEGVNAGDPTTAASSGPGYVYAASDLTNLYNRYNNVWSPAWNAHDITQATRSIIWLNNDYIVVYDRATSIHSGLFKRFNLCLTNNPAINGTTAIETLKSGQQLFVQTLLPKNPLLTSAYAAGNLTLVAELEPTQYIFTVEDPAKPADTRFLHVLQGADPGAAMVPAAYVQSSQGTAFDGAAFGSMVVYFPVSGSGTFTGATLPVPAGVQSLFVTGLAGHTSYGISIQPAVSGKTVSIVPVGTAGAVTATTDDGGVLTFTF